MDVGIQNGNVLLKAAGVKVCKEFAALPIL